MKIQAVAFAGPRPARLPWRDNEFAPGCVALKEIMAAKIADFVNQGIHHYLSGMAMGIDMIAAELLLDYRRDDHRVKMHCILPCTNQAEKWPTAEQERYRRILGQADSICYVNREYHKDCMLERNRFLVDHSTILFAVYKGEPRSGTAATVRYARKAGSELFILSPDTLSITHELPALVGLDANAL